MKEAYFYQSQKQQIWWHMPPIPALGTERLGSQAQDHLQLYIYIYIYNMFRATQGYMSLSQKIHRWGQSACLASFSATLWHPSAGFRLVSRVVGFLWLALLHKLATFPFLKWVAVTDEIIQGISSAWKDGWVRKVHLSGNPSLVLELNSGRREMTLLTSIYRAHVHSHACMCVRTHTPQ